MTFTTPKGTKLDVIDLKGKAYLQVAQRIIWFREEHPDWSIETEFVTLNDKHAMAKATIRDASGRVVSTSHKWEEQAGFYDYREKCETGAIGRALALIGFGTQFCADDLDEGQRIVDSPIDKRKPQQDSKPKVSIVSNKPKPVAESTDPWEFVIQFGKKHIGKRIRDIAYEDLKSYLEWLDAARAKKNQPPDPGVEKLREAFSACYETTGSFEDAPGGPLAGDVP